MNDQQQQQLNTIMILGIGLLGYTWDTREELVKECGKFATKDPLEYALYLIRKVGLRKAYYGRPTEFYDLLDKLGPPLQDQHIYTGMEHWYNNGLFL